MSVLDTSGSPGQPLRVGVRQGAAAVVLALSGELDVGTTALLTREVDRLLTQAQAHPPGVIVEVSQLGFYDSSGLGALIGVRKRLVAAGRPLVLVGAHGTVEQILHRTGLDQVFSCYRTVAEAEHALADVLA
ncbi:STAS domain-containing protein [Nonomuraea dietziae]|uniref:STAS domain-containing protein n=1 Tax=Nonomuraea dietziae TaxID=65515 RepID=UPI0033D39E35